MQSLSHPFVIAALLIGAGAALAGLGVALRGRRRAALVAVGVTAALAGGAYGGVLGYTAWREQSSPSTQQVLVLKDGRQVPLVQPTAAPAATPQPAPATSAAEEQQPEAASAAGPEEQQPEAAPTPAPQTAMPPLRVRIERIGADWPVVLSHNEHLPQFKGVGWLMGSAFPGRPGNIVLFGHLGGPYGTFMRLHELQAGDEFSIITEDGEHRYRVRESYETTPDDVSPLVPTDTATATLITCSGPWDAARQTNERRLIVTADYIGLSPARS